MTYTKFDPTEDKEKPFESVMSHFPTATADRILMTCKFREGHQ